MTNKQSPSDGTTAELPDDLEENPGIGQSKGLFARTAKKDLDLVEGENTMEGDVENDASLGQGAESGIGRENE